MSGPGPRPPSGSEDRPVPGSSSGPDGARPGRGNDDTDAFLPRLDADGRPAASVTPPDDTDVHDLRGLRAPAGAETGAAPVASSDDESAPTTAAAGTPAAEPDSAEQDVTARPPVGDAGEDWLAQDRAVDLPPAAATGWAAWIRRPAVWIPAAVLGVLGLVYAGDLLLAGDAMPRHTVVAGIDVGGLSRDAAAEVLAERGAARTAAVRDATAGPVDLRVDPSAAGIRFDVAATVSAAAEQPLNPLTRLLSLFADREVPAELDVDSQQLAAAVGEWADAVDITFVEGSIEIEGTTATVVDPVDGRTLLRDETAQVLYDALRTGDTGPLSFPYEEQIARVSTDAAAATLAEFVTPALAAGVTLRGEDGVTSELTPEEIGSMLRFGPGEGGTLLATVDEAGLLAGIDPDQGRFATPPVEAGFDLSGPIVQVTPSAPGTRIDTATLSGTLRMVLVQPAPRSADVPIVQALPSLSTDQANALGIREPVSTFTSAFAAGPAGTNIDLAAQRVEGDVIRPGQSYSLNTAIGERTTAAGYVAAAGPDEGPPVVGEGVSPLATAMYNAVFFAGLEEVQRTSHPAYSADFPAGRDAMIAAGGADLVWRNDGETGVVVQVRWTTTAVTVTLWGTRVYDVEAVSGVQTSLVDPPTETRTGADCVTRRGSTGFDITITRVFRLIGNSERLRQENLPTSYTPSARVLCAGAPPPPPVEQPPLNETPVITDPPPLPEPGPPTTGAPTTTTSRPTTSAPPTTTSPPATSSPPTTTSSPPTTTDPPPTTTEPPPTTTDPPPTTTDPPPTTTDPPPTTDNSPEPTETDPPPTTEPGSVAATGSGGPSGAARAV